jgi:acetyl-CoA/propionyl-CoA carboxylase biotin carboxyl carrier protein
VDAGVVQGSVVGGNFDSLLAKIIVTGETRTQALERARRVLDETVVEGLATVLPFHRLVVRDPAFAELSVHTRWIETEWAGGVAPAGPGTVAEGEQRRSVVVEVAGKRLEVRLPADLGGSTPAPAKPRSSARRPGSTAKAADTLTAPMQGTVVKVAAADGDIVAEGDLILVVEAMKMEQPIHAHRSGTVTGLTAGAVLPAGAVICTISAAG